MDKKIPGIPSVNSVKDDETRKVLQSLIDGWRLRNGHTNDAGAQFVTRDELEKFIGAGAWDGGGFRNGVGGNGPTARSNLGGIGGLFRDHVAKIIEEIKNSLLWKSLSSRIDRLDGPGGVLERIGLTETGIKRFTSQTENKIEVIDAQLVKVDDNLAAAVTVVNTEVAEGYARTFSTTTLQAMVDGGNLMAQEALDIINDPNNTTSATWQVKFDIDGYVVGAGLGLEGKDGHYTSQFLVRADRFAVGSPSDDPVFPFIVDTVDGKSIIAMNGQVYIGAMSASDIAENAAFPAMNYLGEYASAPATASLKKNTIYKNTTNKNTYVLGSDGGSWSLFVPAGTTTYTWVAYANDATGTSGFTTGANTGQTYIGIANNRLTSTESTNAADYTWSLIKGDKGVKGDTGYTWFAYANNATGTSGFTTGANTGQTYIGIAANKLTEIESTNAADYTWSLIKGDKGVPGDPGADGDPGSPGSRGSRTFYASGTAWDDSVANNIVATATGSSTRVIGDTVTISNGSTFAATKYWGGTGWLSPGVVIDGNLLVNGTVSAAKIGAGSISTDGGNANINIGATTFIGTTIKSSLVAKKVTAVADQALIAASNDVDDSVAIWGSSIAPSILVNGNVVPSTSVHGNAVSGTWHSSKAERDAGKWTTIGILGSKMFGAAVAGNVFDNNLTQAGGHFRFYSTHSSHDTPVVTNSVVLASQTRAILATGKFRLFGTASSIVLGTKEGTLGQVLTSAGSSTTPTWGTVIGKNNTTTSDVTGHLQIPKVSGQPTGSVTDVANGYAPIVFDSANNKLWIYNGTWKGVVLT